jgi:hypothetical protein
MSEIEKAAESALAGSGSIPRERVVAWCNEAQDVRTLALLYRLTGEAYDRIEPELGMRETCALVSRYLLECIRTDTRDGVAFTRYEAASALESWFDHLSDALEDTTGILCESVRALTSLYLASSADIRLAIETGFLEHALEQERFWPLFQHWQGDERLRESWEAALAWGKAHPNFTRSLRAELRRLDEDGAVE